MSRIACVVLGLISVADSAHAAPAKSPQELRTELAAYSQAIVRNSRDATAYISRGSVRAKLGDDVGAIDDDSTALTLDPKNVVALTNRGNARAARRDFRGALADYNRAITLDPQHKAAYLNRGNVETEQQNYEAAIADADRVLALDPKEMMAVYNRAAAERATGNYEVAIDDYSKVLAAQPNDVRALINRAVLRVAQRNWDQAQDDLNDCLRLLPPDKQIYPRLYLWVVAQKNGSKDQGTQALRGYLSKTPATSATTWPWHIANFCVGEGKDAVAFAADGAKRQARDNKGQLSQADYFAGLKRELAGDPDRALELYHKCALDGEPKMHEVILAREELKK